MLNTIIRLRRDNDYNYNKIKDKFIPMNGELCLIDTAQDGLRVVCGDGVTPFGELEYAFETLVQGYYSDGKFFREPELLDDIPGQINKLYIDKTPGQNGIYYFDGMLYHQIPGSEAEPKVGEFTGETAEIFNDYENNIATYRAFRILSINYEETLDEVVDSVERKYYRVELDDVTGLEWLNPNTGIGHEVSIQLANYYPKIGHVSSVVDNTTVLIYTEDLPLLDTTMSSEGHDSVNGNFLWTLEDPSLGTTDILSQYTHAEGYYTRASMFGAHAEGYNSKAFAKYSHAEGMQSIVTGISGHGEGYGATVRGEGAHAEGGWTIANGKVSHAEGSSSEAHGAGSHAEGHKTNAKGAYSHAEGDETKALESHTHSEGYRTTASGIGAHAEGSGSADGSRGLASGEYSHSEGVMGLASGKGSHAEGGETNATGVYSHAEGNKTTASGLNAHAEGNNSKATGDDSHVEGRGNTAEGIRSHAEGSGTHSVGTASHAEGYGTKANGEASHAEGRETIASNKNTHAEGFKTQALGAASHAEGYETKAQGAYSHAAGLKTITGAEAQVVIGKYNKVVTDAVFVIGNGTDEDHRSNLFEIKTDGRIFINGVQVNL